jgi:hypothetical protein
MRKSSTCRKTATIRRSVAPYSVRVGVRYARLRAHNFVECSAEHVIHGAPHHRVFRQESAGSNPLHVFLNTLFHIGEGVEVKVWTDACRFLHTRPDFFVRDVKQTAPGVVDDQKFTSAKPMRRQHQRPNRIIGCSTAGVSQQVGIADFKPQQPKEVESSVHAGKDNKLSTRCCSQVVRNEPFRVVGGCSFDCFIFHSAKLLEGHLGPDRVQDGRRLFEANNSVVLARKSRMGSACWTDPTRSKAASRFRLPRTAGKKCVYRIELLHVVQTSHSFLGRRVGLEQVRKLHVSSRERVDDERCGLCRVD